MSRIGILTFHRALNYGAVFQTFALYHTIRKMGAKVDVIDYRAKFNEKRFTRKHVSQMIRPREIYSILFQNSYKLYDRSVYSHFCSNMSYSDIAYDQKSLKDVCDKYDCIICGSDQVWNLACTERDDSYFLPFISDKGKKKSYAVSFGYDKLPEKDIDTYSKLIDGFSSIAVREKSGCKIVKSLIGKEAKCVVDPTFLLSPSEWRQYADYSLVPDRPYMFMYLMSEDKDLIKFAKERAREKGICIIYAHERLFKTTGVKNIRNITPEQWLGLLDKADSVCTNSFHGTAFSINYQKDFFVNLINRSIANSRLTSVLDEYNLRSHLISETNSQSHNKCMYKDILEANIADSLRYLSSIIERSQI